MRKITKELTEKSIAELQKEAQSLKEEIAKLTLEAKSNPPKDTNMVFKKRKRLAVILTLISQKKEIEKLKNIKSK
jgi:ribosomal protein L29